MNRARKFLPRTAYCRAWRRMPCSKGRPLCRQAFQSLFQTPGIAGAFEGFHLKGPASYKVFGRERKSSLIHRQSSYPVALIKSMFSLWFFRLLCFYYIIWKEKWVSRQRQLHFSPVLSKKLSQALSFFQSAGYPRSLRRTASGGRLKSSQREPPRITPFSELLQPR